MAATRLTSAMLAILVSLSSFPRPAGAVACNAPELDLCDWPGCPDELEALEANLCPPEIQASSALSRPVPANILTVLLALGLHASGAKNVAWLPLLGPLAGLLPRAGAASCKDLRDFYRSEQCCGAPRKQISPAAVPGASPCPYNFSKPACADAEPQAPRDLTAFAPGWKAPKAAVLTDAQAQQLPLANVHFHLGAEHRSEAYSVDTDAAAYDAAHGSSRRLQGRKAVRPGFMCPTTNLTDAQMAPYTFKYCKGDVQVGKSYEVHYVHSSAAALTAKELRSIDNDAMDDGLGGAANGRGMLNPMIVVEGQVFQIVQGAETVNDMLHGWTVVGHANSVMYSGSTTGQSHDNEICSPYVITWHVDKDCHRVSPESFDNMCKQMKEVYNFASDLYPHGSRKIVDPTFVVSGAYVLPLA